MGEGRSKRVGDVADSTTIRRNGSRPIAGQRDIIVVLLLLLIVIIIIILIITVVVIVIIIIIIIIIIRWLDTSPPHPRFPLSP